MGISYKLEHFEGPLDLLLHLIEKNKVSIYDIPIVTITEQYLDYVNHMDTRDLDLVSEFLVMAATLLDIKARMLLPKEEKPEREGEDPRAELVRRLLEYKMYKFMARELEEMEEGAERPGEKQLWNHKKRAGKSGRKAHLRTVLCQKKQEVQFQADAGILQGQDGDRRFLSGSAGTDEGRKNPPVTGIHRR